MAYPKSLLANGPKRPGDDFFAALETGVADHFFIFRVNGAADAELNGTGKGQH